MESYKDLPPTLKTESGKEVLVHAHIKQAQDDAVSEFREEVARDIVNQSLELARGVAGAEFVQRYITRVWVTTYSHDPKAVKEVGEWLTEHTDSLRKMHVRGFGD